MKKLISLLLVLCLLTGTLYAFAEETSEAVTDDPFEDWDPPEDEPAAGVDFDFILRLHPENLSGELEEKAKRRPHIFRHPEERERI